jgi:basic membrane lipoprotein Med (substrate-binding protein (PBP1-ABC) superfamily)
VQYRTKEGILRRLTKIAAVAVVACLALTGCGKNDAGTTKGTAANADVCKGAKGDGPKVGLAYDVGGRGDQSFNDSAYAGLAKAVKDMKATCTEGEASDGEAESARETRLRDMADAGMNPIIGVGFAYSEAVDAVSKDYKDVSFGVIDGFDPTPDAANANVAYLGFAENEGSFLVGVAAASKSAAHHIGFVGGVHNDLIKKFEAGYVAGAKARASRSTSSTSRRATSPGSVTPPVASRPLPRSTTTVPTWSTTPRVPRAPACSPRPWTPARASGRSVSTPTSTSPLPRTSSRTSSPRCSSASTWRRTT